MNAKIRSIVLATAVTLAVFVLNEAVAAPPQYRFVDLGDLWAGPSGWEGCVNAIGQVAYVDFSSRDTSIWYQGSVQNLGSVAGAAPFRINDQGHFVGGNYYWNGTTKLTIDPPNGMRYSFLSISGINNDDVLVGGVDDEQLNRYVGYTWHNGQFTPLGSLAAGGGSVAYDINNNGVIVGRADTDNQGGPHQAFIITSGTNPVSLGCLPGSARSTAYKINDLNHVVGESSDQQELNQRATLWRDGEIINLGMFTPFSGSQARGLNNHDQVVGCCYANVPGDGRAFLWDSGTMYDLSTLTQNLSGWHLTTANGISDDGVIAGVCYRNDSYHTYALVPVPEPATLFMLSLGGLAMLRRRSGQVPGAVVREVPQGRSNHATGRRRRLGF